MLEVGAPVCWRLVPRMLEVGAPVCWRLVPQLIKNNIFMTIFVAKVGGWCPNLTSKNVFLRQRLEVGAPVGNK